MQNLCTFWVQIFQFTKLIVTVTLTLMVHCSAVHQVHWCSVHCIAVQCRALLYSTVQFSVAQCNPEIQCLLYARFSINWPLGKFSLRVAMSVCVSCAVVPSDAVFNRPGVARAVLQTPALLID